MCGPTRSKGACLCLAGTWDGGAHRSALMAGVLYLEALRAAACLAVRGAAGLERRRRTGPEAGAAFPCSVVPGAVSRRQGQQVDQRAARQADLVAPLVAHDDVAAGGSPHAVAAEVVTLGRRPVELARLVVEAEQRHDALQGSFRVLHQGLVAHERTSVG